MSALINAANKGLLDKVEEFIQNGIDLEATNPDGFTALHMALKEHHEEIARRLLDAGANIHAETNDGWTPLHWAARRGHESHVELLLSYGAGTDVDKRHNKGKTPARVAGANGHHDVARLLQRYEAVASTRNALQAALDSGDVEAGTAALGAAQALPDFHAFERSHSKLLAKLRDSLGDAALAAAAAAAAAQAEEVAAAAAAAEEAAAAAAAAEAAEAAREAAAEAAAATAAAAAAAEAAVAAAAAEAAAEAEAAAAAAAAAAAMSGLQYQGENHALKWFIANRDADYVRKAAKGMGTNEDLLVATLCNKTKIQLDRCSAAYKAKYGVSLKKILKRETSGYWSKLIVYCQMKKKKFDAMLLHDAMAGAGTNEDILNEVVTTRTNEELEQAKEYFQAKYDRSLVDWVKAETSGDYEKSLVRLLTRPRSEGPADEGQAEQQADRLWNAGKGKRVGTDEDVFIDILCGASRDQIQAIKRHYEAKRGHSLESDIKSEMSGSLEKVMLALLDQPIDFFCKALKAAFKGMGTDDSVVARILGGSNKEFAIRMAARYQEKYGHTLEHDLRDELSGHFKDAAVAWVSAVDPTGGLEPITEGPEPTGEAVEQENANLKNYIAQCDAADIRRACKGLGTNDRELVKVVCGRTKTQLDRIDAVYRAEHGKSLKKQIKEETSGNYAKMVRYALMKKHKLDADLLFQAMRGLGTNDSLLIEVLTTRSVAELRAAKEYFEAKHDRSLTDFIASETSGDYKETLLRLLNGERSESEVGDPALAVSQAQRLYDAGVGLNFGTDEAVFIEILTTQSRAQIKLIKGAYEAAFGHSLEWAIKSEVGGDFEDVLLALLDQPADFFARALKKAMAGLGTDEGAIARILGGNDKRMVEKIAKRYEEKYGKSLVDALSSEISGNFKRAAIMWVAGGAPAELVTGEEKGEEEEEAAATAAAAANVPPPGAPVQIETAAPAVQIYGGPVLPPPPVMAQPVYLYGGPVFMPPPPMAINANRANTTGSAMIVMIIN